MTAARALNEFCTNCGIRLSGSFCPECGQKDRELNPPLRHFIAEATDELLNVDGKIFRSVWTLLAKPGVLTRDFFEGRRARWVSPIRQHMYFREKLWRSVLKTAIVGMLYAVALLGVLSATAWLMGSGISMRGEAWVERSSG